MNDLIESIVEHREIAIFVIGLLIIIGAITKGGISIGSFEIPKIETGQAKLLGGLGGSLILLALFLITRPEAKNNIPTASKYSKTIMEGEMLTIPIMDYVEDKDESDTLKILIVEDAKLGYTTIKNDIIKYVGEKDGEDLFSYQVSDGKGGRDTADIQIKVKPLPEKLVTRKGQLINVFGTPKKGKYNIDLINKKRSPVDSIIIANKKGKFELITSEKKELCHINIEGNKTEFLLNYDYDLDTIEYNPLEKIELTYCNHYDKNEKKPDRIVFENQFKIPFDQLETVTKPNGEKDSLEYGVLYLAIKYKGFYADDNEGHLDFYFIQKNGEETVFTYDPVEIPSNAAPLGWRSSLSKMLLKGEYKLIIKSKNGTKLKTSEFEII